VEATGHRESKLNHQTNAPVKTKTIVTSLIALACTAVHAADLTPAETQAIAEEAFIYGLPIVMNYAVMHEYAV
jgi:hypothetical protein